MRLVALCLGLAASLVLYGQQRPSVPLGTTPLPPGLKGPDLPGDAVGYTVQLFITGRVLLESRQPPPEPVEVDYSCRGKSLSAATDAKGRFSLPVGRQQVSRSVLANDLPVIEGCRVEVNVPGFKHITTVLKRPHARGDLNLGDLVLQSESGQANALFSAASGQAPNSARKSYIRALLDIGEDKHSQALLDLDKAVRQYPRYAAALQLKGQILEMAGRREEARAAYAAALEADPQYGKPMVQLAELAAEDQNSAEAVKWAAMVNRAFPRAFPSIYLIEGSAYFNLGRLEDAEKAALAGIEADRTHFHPRLHKLLGEVLYRKHDYAGARDAFKRYIDDAPDAADVTEAKDRGEAAEKLARIAGK